MTCSHRGQSGRFCSECGQRLHWTCEAPGCHIEQPFQPGVKYCRHCGTPTPEWVR